MLMHLLLQVTPRETYRFRMIAAGVLYPFRVSVDGHQITVVATDCMILYIYSTGDPWTDI